MNCKVLRKGVEWFYVLIHVFMWKKRREKREREENIDVDRNKMRQPEQRTQTMCHWVR